jgi:Protein of unknown function (DUF2752)
MRQYVLQLFNRNLLLLASVGLVGAVLVLFLFNPAESSWYPRCVFHEATGLHCPGCGTLRASYLLLHGQFLAALSANALAVIFVAIYAPMYLYRGLKGGGWRMLEPFAFSPWVGWMAVLVVAAFWILRNLNVAPLNWLAP